MTKFRNAVFLTSTLLVASMGTAFAQETAQPVEGEAQEAQEDAASTVESQLSLGEDANANPAVGQTYTREIVGDWEMRCIKQEEGKEDPCQMYQLIDDGEGTPVAEFSLFRLPGSGQAKAGATLVVPLETSLPQQVTITVDGGNARRYPYAFCNQIGCYARIGFTDNDVNAFKRGNAALITIVPALAQDQKVELDLSLTGFTAAFDKVSTVEQ
jgi:invasion protein IalB